MSKKKVLGTCACVLISSVVMTACSAQQKINVKQTQGEQTQQVEIETTSKVDNLALIFNYPGYGINN